LHEWSTWDGRGELTTQGIDTLCEQVNLWCKRRLPGETYEDYADPAGWQRSQTDLRTCVEVMNEAEIYPVPGMVSFESRRKSLSNLLSRMRRGEPVFVVDPSCQMVIEGLQGAYRYRQLGAGSGATYKPEAEKNAWSHPMDALCYITSAVFGITASDRTQEEDEDDANGRLEEVSPLRASKYY
jgi:hypothetical protein